MIVLGIESTAHTFGIGIIKVSKDKNTCKILANSFARYKSKTKGMVPNEIVEHHQKNAQNTLKSALKTANLALEDIDLISYSKGPGIDPILWFGYHFAIKLQNEINKPLIPVNHCAAHLSIGKVINNAKNPVYLYVSGVNTQVIVQNPTSNIPNKGKITTNTKDTGSSKNSKNSIGKYNILGETLDIGLGNMLDKFARILDLGFPGGPIIEKLAKEKNPKPKYIELPYTVKGMDTSFSGILTKSKQLYEKKKTKEGQTITKQDLCFSLQETCFAMLCEISERALAHTQSKELILVGGVGANKRFCEMLKIMCEARGATFYNVPIKLAGDQGVMIAWEGFLRKDQQKKISLKNNSLKNNSNNQKKKELLNVDPNWRTDEV